MIKINDHIGMFWLKNLLDEQKSNTWKWWMPKVIVHFHYTQILYFFNQLGDDCFYSDYYIFMDN